MSRLQFFLLVTLISSMASAKVEKVLGGVALKKNPNLARFLPTTDLPEIILSRKQYVISYNKEKREPNFAVWKLEANQVGKSGRASTFSRDMELDQYLRSSDRSQRAVEPADFTASCFDRGHVVPSADRSDNVEDNKETFLMSNMVPQTSYLNRVIWSHLERYVRDMVEKQGKKVYIIAGPIFEHSLGGIGPNQDIQVPSKEFKIVVIFDANDTNLTIKKDTPMIPVIMPNTDIDGKLPVVDGKQSCVDFSLAKEDMNDWTQYKSTVEEIERLSGLKIFSPL